MKFYLILACLLCLNFLHGQDEEEYTTYETYYSKNIVEGGLEYFIPQSDFKNKSPNEALGGEVSYLRRITNNGLFIGLSYSNRRLDSHTIEDFAPSLDIETRVNNKNYALIGRFYPQLYLSIFEFFAEGGFGLNTIKAFSRDFDQIDQAYYNEFTNNIDYKLFFRGGGGFHVTLDESWFLTARTNTIYGTTVEVFSKKDDLSGINFSEDAFELKEATYRASTISLSLSYIF